MRIKKDKSSWHSSGVIKRDFRHDHNEESFGKHKTKKNTARWCRGRVGKEHIYIRISMPRYSYWIEDYIGRYIELKCLNCNKKVYKKNLSKLSHIPLKIEIEDDADRYYGHFIPVNGKLSKKQLEVLRYYD